MSTSTAGWVLAGATTLLGVLVLVLAALVVRQGRRLRLLEERLRDAVPPAVGAGPRPQVQPEFVITQVGEPAPAAADPVEPVQPVSVSRPVFADLLLKESVVQTASLFHGLRRALAPESRNRIRFHMRQEVKRSRKQRRAEVREARRDWAARQRSAMAAEEGSAA